MRNFTMSGQSAMVAALCSHFGVDQRKCMGVRIDCDPAEVVTVQFRMALDEQIDQAVAQLVENLKVAAGQG